MHIPSFIAITARAVSGLYLRILCKVNYKGGGGGGGGGLGPSSPRKIRLDLVGAQEKRGHCFIHQLQHYKSLTSMTW